MRRLAGLAALVTLALTPAPAQATLGSLHGPGACNPRDAADDSLANGAQRPYTFCDDGVPPTGVGGIVPNLGAANAVPVPAKYQGFLGLPPRAPDAAAQPGADPATGDVALDVNVSLPPASLPGPHPVIFMHHGFTGSKRGWESTTAEAEFDAERWHDNNAWFASRGYVVVTYTMRGFTTTQTNTGSTGFSGPYTRELEINDLQNLACKLAGDPFFGIDPSRVVVTGGSGGGGTTWLAITDPTWNCASEGAPARDMRIVAAAPKYAWTDLVESLVPNGAHLRDRLPAFDGSTVLSPLGYPKKIITAGFIARGNAGLDSPEKATLPPLVDEVVACIYGPDPLESSPLCATTIATHGRTFLTERSAYYQNHFFDRIASDPTARVPIFSAGAFADPIFTQAEHDRFAQRARSVVPGYPIQEYYGDYQHFVQNKAKEWGDLCGADRHVCRISDYPGGDLSASPTGLVRRGVTSRLNRFIDHFARPAGNPAEPAPSFDTTADLLVCPENATPQTPKDEGGEQFTGASVAALAPNTLRIAAPGTQTTSSLAIPNGHAVNDDPLVNSLRNGNRCPVDAAPGGAASAGPGVATYDSAPLARAYTMIGRTRVTVPHRGTGASVQLNSRLYDLFPDGRQVMVDRSSRRLSSATGTTVFDLHGQGWRFPAGHRIRIELNQDDDPYIRRSSDPSGLTLAGVTLEVPVREGGASIGGGPAAFGQATRIRAPRMASDAHTGPRETVILAPRGARAATLQRYELQSLLVGSRRARYRGVRPRSGQPDRRGRMLFTVTGALGTTLRLRARAVQRGGNPGRFTYTTTVIPFDDAGRASPARYSGAWRRLAARGAYLGRVSRASARGARMSLRFRGARIYLIGRRGPAGGRARILLDGRRIKWVDFFSRRARQRGVIFSRYVSRRRAHTLTVVVIGRGDHRSRGHHVEVDALGVLR